jgi:hypothetical protein
MVKSIAGSASLLAIACLIAPVAAHAQGAQHNETDLQFIQRMTASVKRTEAKAEQLEETLDKMAQQVSRENLLGEDRYEQQGRLSSGSKEETYRRAGRKLRSLQNKAEKEREKLADLQRSTGGDEQLDRKTIEASVTRLERDVAAVEHDLRLGRY